MTDISELVKRLRDRAAPDGTVGWAHPTYPPQKVKDALCAEAADALEAQADRIAERDYVLEMKWRAEERAIRAWQEKTRERMTWPADQEKLVEWLMDELYAARARIAELEAALDHMHKGHDALVEYIAELETALKPLAKAWLFPDDLGEEASVIIRCDPDWNEEENDMSREDVIVCRREIRKARAALNGEK